MAFAQQGNRHHTKTENINMQTNSLRTYVNENVHQGKTQQVQNSHDSKQFATMT